jgi:hypothetical protein
MVRQPLDAIEAALKLAAIPSGVMLFLSLTMYKVWLWLCSAMVGACVPVCVPGS